MKKLTVLKFANYISLQILKLLINGHAAGSFVSILSAKANLNCLHFTRDFVFVNCLTFMWFAVVEKILIKIT